MTHAVLLRATDNIVYNNNNTLYNHAVSNVVAIHYYIFTQSSDMLNKNTYRVLFGMANQQQQQLSDYSYIATCDQNYDINKGQELAIAIGREYKCDWI